MTYLIRCWGAGGEGAVLETQLPKKSFLLEVLFSSPPSHGTAISCTVVYQEALRFPAKLKSEGSLWCGNG